MVVRFEIYEENGQPDVVQFDSVDLDVAAQILLGRSVNSLLTKVLTVGRYLNASTAVVEQEVKID